ncbi:MAG: NAD-dependent epimerase/dehydratase family protein [Lentisphaerae bacterium]|nr:NAD-dependent epimerase/dehydratase family protein [Lentisphaerota bacterium]
MKILITGICGFVGRLLALGLLEHKPGLKIIGLDNLVRPGSELFRRTWKTHGVAFHHGDIRSPSDLENLPECDWILDAAANPSVLAGVDGKTSSRQLVEHNLQGTINLLELCKQWSAGFIMLSTSRVYSISALAALPMKIKNRAFVPAPASLKLSGVTPAGITEEFPSEPPLSFYGTAKKASETLALEYGSAFDLPVWINRCGVMAGAGQFGKPDQGIFSFWIHSWRQRKPMAYIGFKGAGCQVRDCLHPLDLVPLLIRQMQGKRREVPAVLNTSGGMANSISLAQLSAWCAERFGPRKISAKPANRPYDVPWLVLNSRRAQQAWNWAPATSLEKIFEEIARQAEQQPGWLELSEDEPPR